MKKYSLVDLQINDDSIGNIQRRASWFGGEKPRSRRFVGNLMRDFIFLNAMPIRAEKIDQWWAIYTDTDWLRNGDTISLEPFYRTISFPIIGVNSMRSEILVTALADAAVTSGSDGITWLTGDKDFWISPQNLNLLPPNAGNGRMLAFTIDGGE